MENSQVGFYDVSYLPSAGLTYSVIVAEYKGKWVYVRHRNRKTWEIPGGHIEDGETADEAASRELMEETGALKFSVSCVATYSVTKSGNTGFGRLYHAIISDIGDVPDKFEIAEVRFSDTFPGELTYPDIQPVLMERVIRYIRGLPS
jgi:8-oxo-dGTP diphosphatase